MFYLVLHILFSTGFGLVVKDAQVRTRNLWAVGAVNYFVAAIGAFISLIWVVRATPDLHFFACSPPTFIVGVFAGIGYVVSYFFLLTIVQTDGISVPMAVVRLSAMIPVLFSIFYWREKPNLYQILGIACVCLVLPLLSQNHLPQHGNQPKPKREGRQGKYLILLLFLTTGWSSLSTKVFVQVSPQDPREFFLFFLFGTSAVVSLIPLVVLRILPTLPDLLSGILLGLCNVFGNHFLLIALTQLPGIIVFPISSALGIALNTVLAVAVWKEKLRWPVVVGLTISVLALVLINLK